MALINPTDAEVLEEIKKSIAERIEQPRRAIPDYERILRNIYANVVIGRRIADLVNYPIRPIIVHWSQKEMQP